MGRTLPTPIRTLALIAALALGSGCKEREQLEREAPALAHANLRIDRVAIAGVVSDVPALGDSTANRAHWSHLIGAQLGRERFGRLPIVSSSDVRALLGADAHDLLLDRFQDDGGCDSATLVEIHTVLEGTARFIVFVNIQDDRIAWSEKQVDVVNEKKEIISTIRTMTTSRTTSVRLRFYDLTDQQLVWDHLSVGQSIKTKEHDMTDIIEHDPDESFLGGLITAIANSALKPDPTYPATPAVESSLANAFGNVGTYLRPGREK
jgi:hypothetical protein